MKKIKLILLSLSIVSIVSSCRDENFGDNYNKDENGIYVSDYKSLIKMGEMHIL